jgi:hypothetical protein
MGKLEIAVLRRENGGLATRDGVISHGGRWDFEQHGGHDLAPPFAGVKPPRQRLCSMDFMHYAA